MSTVAAEKVFALRTMNAGAARVDREQKVLRGVVVLKRGVAKGHGLEIDDTALDQIVALGNAEPAGVKSRFSHPEEDALGGRRRDAIGSYLGRFKNFRREADLVRADLYLAASAFTSPRGDLGGYVLTLAEEDPTAFGASLVARGPRQGRRPVDGQAQLPLARFTQLTAVDLVDDPAATDSLFSSLEKDLEMSDVNPDAAAAAKAAEEKAAADKAAAEKATAEKALAAEAEKLAADNKQRADAALAATREEATQLAAKRATDILALCTRAGVPDKAAGFIGDVKFSVADVKEQLFDVLCKKNPPVGDDGGKDRSAGSGDPNEKYKSEFRQHVDVHRKMGVSEEDYVLSRRIEDGLEPLTPPRKPPQNSDGK